MTISSDPRKAVAQPKPRVGWLRSALLASVMLPGAALADTPFERSPVQLGFFNTANVLPDNALSLTFGFQQTDPSAGAGTGNQMYFLGAEYAWNDRLSFGLNMQTFEDPIISPINGLFPTLGIDNVAASAKYLAFDGPKLDVAVMGSVEFFRMDNAVFGTDTGINNEHILYSVSAPMTYSFNDRFQAHVTPGVSIFPDEINGTQFFGTVPYVGVGASFRATDRVTGYGSISLAFGSGGNAVTSTGGVSNTPVWTLGGRYTVTPKLSADVYVTNAFGTTPATSIMANWPDGDDIMIGGRLVWTPGQARNGYRSSFGTLTSLTDRQLDLQQDGFTLASADTYEPGTFAARAWYGTQGSYGAGAILAPDQDGQIEAYIEEYANDGSVPAGALPSVTARYKVGTKIRFMDQNNGDAFSFSLRLLGGREIGTGVVGSGVLYADAIASYKVNPAFTVTVNPKIAAFGNTERLGLGLGGNYEILPGLQLIGEITPVNDGTNTDMVWAAGARYSVRDYGLSIDAHATNAIGSVGLGTMIAQDDTRFSVSLTKQLDLSNWR